MERVKKRKQLPAGRRDWRGIWATTVNFCETAAVYLYHFRKLLLCIPVVVASIYLARLSWTHLPDEVGLSMMVNGQFAQMVTKQTAIYGPMAVTGICLVLMLCSRRALYPWLISLFTLIVPVFILFTNIFPS